MRPTIWVLACLALAACGLADGEHRLAVRIEELISARADSRTSVSLLAVDAETAEPILSRAPGLLLHPASCQKLLTVAALLADPRDHTVSTRLRLYPGGELVLEGGGDPLLSVADLGGLASRALPALPARARLWADASIFPGPALGNGWMWDDEPLPFMPRVTGLSVHRGVVQVTVEGGRRTARVQPEAAAVLLAPAAGLPHPAGPEGQVSLTRGPPGSDLDAVLSWSLPEATRSTRSISVARPERLALRVLAAELEALGVRVTIGDAGRETRDQTQGSVVASLDRAVLDLLPAILSESDNLAAECLLRLLGVWSGGTGTDSAGLRVVEAHLDEAVPEGARGRAADGSGVSHYDLVTARELVSLMQDLRRRPRAWKRFVAGLSEAGVSGTLADRPQAVGHLRGKTGTLSGVSTLAGVATRPDGQEILFAILVQNYLGSAAPWRELQDAICRLLLEAPTRR